jgi:hypothetical protein
MVRRVSVSVKEMGVQYGYLSVALHCLAMCCFCTAQVLTTNNCYTIADFQAPNYSTLSFLSLLSLVVAW